MAEESELPAVYGGRSIGHPGGTPTRTTGAVPAPPWSASFCPTGGTSAPSPASSTRTQAWLGTLEFREAVVLAGLSDERVAHGDFSETGGAAGVNCWFNAEPVEQRAGHADAGGRPMHGKRCIWPRSAGASSRTAAN